MRAVWQAPAAPSRSSAWSTTVDDIDSLPAVVADGIDFEFVRLRPARFSARWTVVQLPSIVVQFGRAQNPLIHHLRTPADRWVFVVPMAAPYGGRSNGSPIGEADIVVCPPSTERCGFDPGGTDVALVSMDGPTVAPIAEIVATWPAIGDVVHIGRDQAAALRQLLQRTRHEFDVRPARGSSVHHDIADGFRRALVATLRDAVKAAAKPEGVRSRLGVVRQAEEFIRHNGGEKISISHLSSIVGVSERSLRNAFHDVYATGPKRYLMLCQLHRVRRALRAPVDPGRTVTDVATLHGFFELGRFAGDYKALFGEGPSQTLSRARRLRLNRNAPETATATRDVPVRRRLVA
jgi:AraC-like DNA-binding protein